MVLREWLSQLEKTFAVKDFPGISNTSSLPVNSNLDVHLYGESEKKGLDEESGEERKVSLGTEETGGQMTCDPVSSLCESSADSFRVHSPCTIANSLQKDLVELTTLCLELNVLTSAVDSVGGHVEGALQQLSPEILAGRFLRKYFFLLDLKRAKESIKLAYDSPCVWDTFVDGLKGNYQVALAHVEVFNDVGTWQKIWIDLSSL